MLSPIERNQSLSDLLRDLVSPPNWTSLANAPTEVLAYILRPAATIAYWIMQFHPELVDGGALKVVVVGAEGLDALDDGAWYQFVPWMIGRQGMSLEVCLVGPDVRKPLLDLLRTAHGTPRTSLGGRVFDFPCASVRETEIGHFLAGQQADNIDLFVLFHPRFEKAYESSWLPAAYSWLNGELSELCAYGSPIAATSYCEEELQAEKFLLEAYGYQVAHRSITNPFCAEESVLGSWGNTLYEVRPVAPAAEFSADSERLDQYDRYVALSREFSREDPPAYLARHTGRLMTIQVQSENGIRLEEVVGLPRENLVISLVTGKFLDDSEAIAESDEDLEGIEASPDVLAAYPRDLPFEYAHILWAIDVYNQAVDRGAN